MTKPKPKVEAQGADPFMVNALADRMFCDIDFGNLKLAVTATHYWPPWWRNCPPQ
jgi:hypothetical protein